MKKDKYSKKALESIIKEVYRAIGCSEGIINTEDWGGLPSRVACLKAAISIPPPLPKKTSSIPPPLPSKKPKEREHTKECGWHQDWHSCNCGLFDIEPKAFICDCCGNSIDPGMNEYTIISTENLAGVVMCAECKR